MYNMLDLKGLGKPLAEGYGTSVVLTSNRGYIVCSTQNETHHMGEVILTIPFQGVKADTIIRGICEKLNKTV